MLGNSLLKLRASQHSPQHTHTPFLPLHRKPNPYGVLTCIYSGVVYIKAERVEREALKY